MGGKEKWDMGEGGQEGEEKWGKFRPTWTACNKTWNTHPKATHSPALIVPFPGVVQWREG